MSAVGMFFFPFMLRQSGFILLKMTFWRDGISETSRHVILSTVKVKNKCIYEDSTDGQIWCSKSNFRHLVHFWPHFCTVTSKTAHCIIYSNEMNTLNISWPSGHQKSPSALEKGVSISTQRDEHIKYSGFLRHLQVSKQGNKSANSDLCCKKLLEQCSVPLIRLVCY